MESKCSGSITRRRVTKESVEESIIDFVLISDDLEQECESLVIDENRDFALGYITKTKTGIKKKESDH